MRTGILFLLTLILLTPVKASTNEISTSELGVNIKRTYNSSISFVERGVEFHVFLNGNFDFNTHFRNNRYVDYRGRRSRVDRGVRIERDYRGKIRRVGNVFVNYDNRGNVTRIGNVFMRYRRGHLIRVGDLSIRYDRWGNPYYEGSVKNGVYFEDGIGCDDSIGIDINIGDIYDYNDVYFNRRNFRNNYRQFREDDNYFYYRATPNADIGKRSKVLRRKKQKSKSRHFKNTTPEQQGRSRRNR
ncbi:hypothetical protein SAMN04489761_0220 [Tenacibaculum sp. MAR_2009_124]|uniref:hypothetical protein n=1 Tax=Tenacibaculum sp. MAR_2009_124 TaxID=1250059 RepID=UPI00089569C5|nr:hypothetical protein [Tenacibaculum sp. MAR_2009_124]SEB37051.1 hypothetical protein SAMN04489761_0220 [Tenacibaculum sp. MAR_2009_124]